MASLGWAGDRVDLYTVDVPAGTKAQGRPAARRATGSRSAGCRSDATDAVLTGVPRTRLTGSQITLPAGRSLLEVTRGQGAGPYTLALVGAGGG